MVQILNLYQKTHLNQKLSKVFNKSFFPNTGSGVTYIHFHAYARVTSSYCGIRVLHELSVSSSNRRMHSHACDRRHSFASFSAVILYMQSVFVFERVLRNVYFVNLVSARFALFAGERTHVLSVLRRRLSSVWGAFRASCRWGHIRRFVFQCIIHSALWIGYTMIPMYCCADQRILFVLMFVFVEQHSVQSEPRNHLSCLIVHFCVWCSFLPFTTFDAKWTAKPCFFVVVNGWFLNSICTMNTGQARLGVLTWV